MAHGTTNMHGHGFIVRDVPEYLDEDCKRAPHGVYKGKASATKRAAAEADWSKRMGLGEVETVVAEQIPGFEGYWFVVWVYTDERAALTKANFDRRAAAEAERVRALAERR